MQSIVKRAPVAIVGLVALLPTACISVQALEPVIEPPHQFQFDTAAEVEFVSPPLVGIRCAERGATFYGLPAINSGACADSQLITMIDPCQTVTAGAFARILCEDSRRAFAHPASPDTSPGGQPPLTQIAYHPAGNKVKPKAPPQKHSRSVSFYAPGSVDSECVRRGLTPEVDDGIEFCVSELDLLIANPCDLYAHGWYERTLCHELAHFNGWAADHSSGNAQVRLALARYSPEAIANAVAAPTESAGGR